MWSIALLETTSANGEIDGHFGLPGASSSESSSQNKATNQNYQPHNKAPTSSGFGSYYNKPLNPKLNHQSNHFKWQNKTQEIKAEEEALATNSCQVGDKWSHFLGCNIDGKMCKADESAKI